MTDMEGMTDDTRTGFFAALSAYLIWGLLPLYLHLVRFATPLEVLGQRILWSIPASMVGVLLMGGFRETGQALRRKGVLPALLLSSLLIAGNWGIYVWAIAAERVIEASLAYFLTPLVQVAFGVLLFRERLSAFQGAALALAAAGIVVQSVALGAFPVVAVALCATWSCYGLVRKAAPVPAAGGLLVETIYLAPLAAAALIWINGHSGLAFPQSGAHAGLLALSGVATGLPLILFAFGARRLRFSTIAMLQFIAPTIQFFIGVALGEPLSPLRLASFALIWTGLALFAWDALRKDPAPQTSGEPA